MLLTVKEVADRLRCGLTNVYALFGTGELRGMRVGRGRGGIRIHQDALMEFIDGRLKKAEPPLSKKKARIPNGCGRILVALPQTG